jgi:hypothetical protein
MQQQHSVSEIAHSDRAAVDGKRSARAARSSTNANAASTNERSRSSRSHPHDHSRMAHSAVPPAGPQGCSPGRADHARHRPRRRATEQRVAGPADHDQPDPPTRAVDRFDRQELTMTDRLLAYEERPAGARSRGDTAQPNPVRPLRSEPGAYTGAFAEVLVAGGTSVLRCRRVTVPERAVLKARTL